MINPVNPLSTTWYRCTRCKASFLVQDSDSDKHLLKKVMRCPNYSTCKWQIRQKHFTTNDSTIHNARWISAVELFQASAGVGLPEERKCSVADVKKLLVGSRVVSVNLSEAPDPKKSVLYSMTLDNGKTVHLTTSVRGPMVFKVTEASNGR